MAAGAITKPKKLRIQEKYTIPKFPKPKSYKDYLAEAKRLKKSVR